MEYFSNFGIKDLADVLCVALLLFYLYKTMKRSGSLNMFIGIMVFILIWMVVSQVLEMQLLGAILDKLIDVGVIALIILFADDIRRAFRELGNRTRTGGLYNWLFKHRKGAGSAMTSWHSVVRACANMSGHKVGALIVIQNQDQLNEFMQVGELINADISQRLIENIFFKNSPLHDGAMVIHNGRIESAAGILPVSHREDIPKQFGLRHRAALGIAGSCDATAIVVSEETGGISIFRGEQFKTDISPEKLEAFLTDPGLWHKQE